MFSIKINIMYIVFTSIITKIQSLVEVSTADDININFTETANGNTTNHFISALHGQDENWKPKLHQYFALHNYISSPTSKNLAKITRLVRVSNIDNNTQYLITTINSVSDKSDKSNKSNSNDNYVAKYVDKIIEKLKYFKKIYAANKKAVGNKNSSSPFEDNNTTSLTRNKKNKTEVGKLPHDEEDDFWKLSGRRIFKGFRTRIKNFPFLASIHFFKKFQCAGSIIKDDLVITSASCLQLSWNNRFFRENPVFLSIQIGSDYYEHGGESITVREIYFYPKYDPKTLKHNLAIMRLSRRINFKKGSRRVKKIDIDRNPRTWIPKPNYDIITVVGWGARDGSNIVYNVKTNRLSYAELEYYPLHECRKHYSREFVKKRNFCAGYFSKGAGACNRDAGGPAICNGLLMGVISFGSPICGSPDSPTVFTKLGFYAKWIDRILNMEVRHIYKRTTTPSPLIFTLPEKSTTTNIILTPLNTIKESVPDKDLGVLRIPDQLEYNMVFPFEYYEKQDTKLSKEGQKISSSIINQQRQTIETTEKTMKEIVKVTAFVPVLETTKQDENSSELEVSDINESNDPPEETGAESTKRISDFANVVEEQEVKNKIMALVQSVDTDKFFQDVYKKVAERLQDANFRHGLEQNSDFNYTSLSSEEGLSIPIEPYNNRPIQILPRTYDYEKLSEPLLIEVVSQAIEEEIKQQVTEKKYQLYKVPLFDSA